jgi:hypothetical protein
VTARKMHPSRAERARRAELRELAALMRERVGLAPAPMPMPLHRMGQRRRQEGDSDRDSAPEMQRPRLPRQVRQRT